MSPILLRPIREQTEHDRVIRLLQGRFRRRHTVGLNLGDEQAVPVRIGTKMAHPDVVLMSLDRSRRLQGIIEVETTESVNTLEAMAQWAQFARARVPFYLYVPAGAAEMARRLCEDNQAAVSEIWTYHAVGQQMRFAMAYRAALPKTARRARPRKTAARKSTPSKAKRVKRAPRAKRR